MSVGRRGSPLRSVEELASEYYAMTLVWEIDELVSAEGDEKDAYQGRNQQWYVNRLATARQKLDNVRASLEASPEPRVAVGGAAGVRA